MENKMLSVSIQRSENSSVTTLEENVLKLISNNKNITSEELSSITNKSVRTIKTILMGLQNKKIIKRMNGKRYGYWQIL